MIPPTVFLFAFTAWFYTPIFVSGVTFVTDTPLTVGLNISITLWVLPVVALLLRTAWKKRTTNRYARTARST